MNATENREVRREIYREKSTGYPSIDKPWRKYYSKEALQVKLPVGSMYDYVFRRNEECLDDIALVY